MIAEIAEATVRLGDMESEVTIMMDGAEFCDHAWLSKRNCQSHYKWSVVEGRMALWHQKLRVRS